MEQKNQLEQIVLQADAEQGAYRKGYKDGYTTAQQSQPMWREIEPNERYCNIFATKLDCGAYSSITVRIKGSALLNTGYTHYLSSEDLLKLPIEKK